eukprot:4952981-Pyramimonas_sp.AAC.3
MAAWLAADGCATKAEHQSAFFVASISRQTRCEAREALREFHNGERLLSMERPRRAGEPEEPVCASHLA